MADPNPLEVWIPALGRSMAFIALNMSEFKDKPIGEKAKFLQELGVPRKDIAVMLKSSEESIRKLISYLEKPKDKSKKGEPKNG